MELQNTIYSSLLYQIINNLMLQDDKQKMKEYIDYLQVTFGYSSNQHKQLLTNAQALPKPNRICDLKVIEAINVNLQVIPEEIPPRLFVTAEFEKSNGTTLTTKINEAFYWNQTLSLLLDDLKMEENLIIRIWNNYPPKEEAYPGQKLLGGIFYKQVTNESPMNDIVYAGKRASYLIGKVSIPMKAIIPSSIFNWQIIDKRDPSNRKSFIKLKVEFTFEENDHFCKDARSEYCILLEKLLSYELKESNVTEYWWDGKFTKTGDAILTNYRTSRDMTKADVRLQKWNTFCNTQGEHPLAFGLFNDILEDMTPFIQDGTYTSDDLKLFWNSSVKLIQYTMEFLKVFQFNNERRVNNSLVFLYKLKSIISMIKVGILGKDMFSEVPINDIDKKARESLELLTIDTLKENIKLWFDVQTVNEKQDCDQEDGLLSTKMDASRMEIEKIGQVLNNLEAHLTNVNTYYLHLFKKYMCINITELFYNEVEPYFVEWASIKVKSIARNIDPDISNHRDLESCKNLLKEFRILYFIFKNFVDNSIKSILPSIKSTKFSHYYEWFDSILAIGFKAKAIDSEEKIKRAVKLDQSLQNEEIKYTSSATDTFEIIYAIFLEFKQTAWPDTNRAFEIITSTILPEFDDACSLYYDEIVRPILPSLTNNVEELSLRKDIIQKFSSIMNNLEYISNKIPDVIEGLYKCILSPDDPIILHKNYPGLNNLLNTINSKSQSLVERLICDKMSNQISRLLKQITPDVVKSPKAFDPLNNYIDELMKNFNIYLTDETYGKVLNAIWSELLIRIRKVVDKKIGVSMIAELEKAEQDVQFFISFKQFFDNIKESFDGAIALNSAPEALEFIEFELRKRGCSPLELIHSHYLYLNEEQKKPDKTFGVLTVSGKFNDKHLELHILNGRFLMPKITASSENSKPDTYVEVQFLFSNSSKFNLSTRKTPTVNENDFPLYDTTFSVKLENNEVELDDTIIVFTLWDPDYFGMVQNYLGEASISFKDLKETAGEQIQFNLWKPHDKRNECIANLKSRTDKQAKELYKYFKLKCESTANESHKRDKSPSILGLKWQ